MSWDGVGDWLAELRGVEPGPFADLSAEGAAEAYRAALAALDPDSLDALRQLPGGPWRRAAVVAAGTVATAPLEWCVALLGRGSDVVLKHPSDDAGLAPLFAETARRVGLPLTATADRGALALADFVVAMGSDETVRAIGEKLPESTRYEPHGHRFSVAWVTGKPVEPDALVPAAFQGTWDGIAADAALHDGRGCLSPVVVFTPRPLAEACEALFQALGRAEAAWPLGRVHAEEGAAVRARTALARATGVSRDAARYHVHGLGASHLTPAALPRSLVVVEVRGVEDAVSALRPWAGHLSTVGTDDPDSTPAWLSAGASRVCRVGRMQRPPVLRMHDGVDWVRTTMRETS